MIKPGDRMDALTSTGTTAMAAAPAPAHAAKVQGSTGAHFRAPLDQDPGVFRVQIFVGIGKHRKIVRGVTSTLFELFARVFLLLMVVMYKCKQH